MNREVVALLRRVLAASTAAHKRQVLEPHRTHLEDFGRFLFAHINIHLAEGNIPAARVLLRNASALRQLYDCTNYDYFFLKARARVLHAEHNVPAALRVFRELLRKLETETDSALMEARAEISMELGLLYDESGNKRLARRYFERAYREAVTTHCVFNQGAALFNLAAVSLDAGNHVEFERHCRQVIQLSRENALTPHLARALLLLANHWDFKETPRLARSFYLEALTVYWKLPDMVKVSEILTRAGELAGALGETSEYVLALHEALQLSRKLDFLQGLTAWTFWAANICRDLGMEERAFRIFEACGTMALSLSMEREKVGGAFRAFQCLGDRATEPLWTWLERQAPPVGTPGAEGFDATGLPLVQYFWSETAGNEPGIYAAYGEDGARLTAFTQSKVSRPPLVSRQRLVYLLSQLSLTDNAFFTAEQRIMLCQEAREVDSHVRRPRNG